MESIPYQLKIGQLQNEMAGSAYVLAQISEIHTPKKQAIV
jgi:hypothetical protein